MDESTMSSSVAFELDGSTGQLGYKVPKEVSDSAKKVEALDFLKWGVRASVVSVQQGQLAGKSSTLIVFQFSFSISGNSRLAEAEIAATFGPAAAAAHNNSDKTVSTAEEEYPILQLCCPTHIQGLVRRAMNTNDGGSHMTVGTPSSLPIAAEIGVSGSKGVQYLKDYSMRIRGQRWDSSKVEEEHIARWYLTEDSKQGDGIPRSFRSAVVVENHGQSFQGTVKITAKSKLGLRVLGWPWSAPKPILFRHGVTFGEQLDITSFDELSDAHWRQLCPVSEVVSVSLTWTCYTCDSQADNDSRINGHTRQSGLIRISLPLCHYE
jgi:hypothetical protein